MKIKIYSVHDNQANAFLNPFFMNSDAEARRAIVDLTRDADHLFGRHPADYALYCHGELDNVAGTFDTFENPKKIISCLEIVAAEKDLESEVEKFKVGA